MKNKILLLTIIGCLALLSAAAQRPAQKTAQRVPQKTERKAARKPAGAHLQLAAVSHDFGDVARKGGDLVCDFVFTNDGTVPLVLTRVITSCSCLKATFPKRPVAPGGQGVVRITYETRKSEPGAFNKVIQVYSNSTDERVLLVVKGNSIDENYE